MKESRTKVGHSRESLETGSRLIQVPLALWPLSKITPKLHLWKTTLQLPQLCPTSLSISVCSANFLLWSLVIPSARLYSNGAFGHGRTVAEMVLLCSYISQQSDSTLLEQKALLLMSFYFNPGISLGFRFQRYSNFRKLYSGSHLINKQSILPQQQRRPRFVLVSSFLHLTRPYDLFNEGFSNNSNPFLSEANSFVWVLEGDVSIIPSNSRKRVHRWRVIARFKRWKELRKGISL